ncbi:MAG TPA: hypothetical protein VKV33_04520 [Streptosporangiaceae bacterium]|nr:hypothetical protein [Streptosporangiaceae bacterium]
MDFLRSLPAFIIWLFWILLAIVLVALVALLIHHLGGFSASLNIGHFHFDVGVTG